MRRLSLRLMELSSVKFVSMKCSPMATQIQLWKMQLGATSHWCIILMILATILITFLKLLISLVMLLLIKASSYCGKRPSLSYIKLLSKFTTAHHKCWIYPNPKTSKPKNPSPPQSTTALNTATKSLSTSTPTWSVKLSSPLTRKTFSSSLAEITPTITTILETLSLITLTTSLRIWMRNMMWQITWCSSMICSMSCGRAMRMCTWRAFLWVTTSDEWTKSRLSVWKTKSWR